MPAFDIPNPDSEPIQPHDFLPSASLETLQQRAELLAEVRRHFHAGGYWEVETPLLSQEVIIDAHLEPFAILEPALEMSQSVDGFDSGKAPLFLQTSPEAAMKRLLVTGATAVFQITRALRRGEFGPYHNPEFTMVEWYRTGDTHNNQMDVVEELVRAVFQRAAELREAGSGGRESRGSVGRFAVEPPFDRMTYDEAFERWTGIRVLDLGPKPLSELGRKHGVAPPESLRADDRDGWLNLLLAELVEPHLGQQRPVFLFDYPASQAALARIRDGDPPVAERFELYADGIELCNGYHELTDVQELRKRMRRQSQIRAEHGLRPLPEPARLLAAIQAGLPACAGVALGFDRLAMLALGKGSLAEVLAFPFDRA